MKKKIQLLIFIHTYQHIYTPTNLTLFRDARGALNRPEVTQQHSNVDARTQVER